MSSAPFALGISTPSSPGRVTAARSSSARPLSSALTRTKKDQSRGASSSDQLRDAAARRGLLRRRDGILEIEDQRVGADAARLDELPFGIAGNEQQRAQLHAGFLSMSATRRQRQTISSRWLNPLCSNVTMPWRRPRLALAQRDNHRLGVDRVAGEHRLRERDLFPAEIADRGPERRVLHREADDEPQREDRIDRAAFRIPSSLHIRGRCGSPPGCASAPRTECCPCPSRCGALRVERSGRSRTRRNIFRPRACSPSVAGRGSTRRRRC